MSHLEALDVQLKLLGVTDLAGAEIESARGLAVLLDSDPSVDWVWREYRFALRAVREVLDDGGSVGDDLEAEFRELEHR